VEYPLETPLITMNWQLNLSATSYDPFYPWEIGILFFEQELSVSPVLFSPYDTTGTGNRRMKLESFHLGTTGCPPKLGDFHVRFQPTESGYQQGPEMCYITGVQGFALQR
jgi:hypothetical protein